MNERIFILHPGLSGYITPYWELCVEEDSIVYRLRAGEIRQADLIVSARPLPPGWAPGRFVAPVDVPGQRHLIEELVAGQIEIDLERGLLCCPPWLRDRYRDEANRKVET